MFTRAYQSKWAECGCLINEYSANDPRSRCLHRSAPALLEALEKCAAALDNGGSIRLTAKRGGWTGEEARALETARAAIAAARGER